MDILTEYQDYLEDLCKKNKQVQHLVDSRKSFFRFTNEDSGDISAKVSSPYIKHTLFTAAGKAQSMWLFSSVIEIIVQVNGSATGTGLLNIIDMARAKAFGIAEEFDAKIFEDHDTGGRCAFMEDLFEPIIQPIGPVDSNGYGVEMTIKFAVSKKDYDQSKWLA